MLNDLVKVINKRLTSRKMCERVYKCVRSFMKGEVNGIILDIDIRAVFSTRRDCFCAPLCRASRSSVCVLFIAVAKQCPRYYPISRGRRTLFSSLVVFTFSPQFFRYSTDYSCSPAVSCCIFPCFVADSRANKVAEIGPLL